jgi:hypothetical protein
MPDVETLLMGFGAFRVTASPASARVSAATPLPRAHKMSAPSCAMIWPRKYVLPARSPNPALLDRIIAWGSALNIMDAPPKQQDFDTYYLKPITTTAEECQEQ